MNLPPLLSEDEEGSLYVHRGELLQPFSRRLEQQLRGSHATASAEPSWDHLETAIQNSLSPEQWAEAQKFEADCPRQMRQGMYRLSKFQTPEGSWHCTIDEFMAAVRQNCPPHYRAGALHRPGHCRAVHRLLDNHRGSGNVDEVLRLADEGAKLQFAANPFSTEQQQRPQFEDKQRAAEAMLAGMGKEEARAALQQEQPPSVWCGSLRSAEQPAANAAFTQAEVQQWKRLGILLPWRQEWGPPHSISPHGCVAPEGRKQRVITAPLLLNWYERYQPFSMERRSDVEQYVLPGYHCWKWDAKRGYMLIPMHPSMWKYLCICVDGEVLCYSCLFFGLSSAPRTYSIVQGELHRCMRETGGEMMSFLLDDKMGAAPTLAEACYRCLTGVMIIAAAGIFFSIEKCIFWPQQLLPWLGLLLGTTPVPYWKVPDDKMQRIRLALKQLLEAQAAGQQVSARQLASIAGLLISVQDAMPLPHLLASGLGLAMQGAESWDSLMPLHGQLRFFLEWVLQHMDELNGNTWFKPPEPVRRLQLIADTSERAHAACLYDDSSSQPVAQVQVAFTAQQQAAAEQQQWSSTAREQRGLRLGLEALLQRPEWQHQLQHKRLLIGCDNQGTVNNNISLKANSWDQLHDIFRIYELLRQNDIRATFYWLSRTHSDVQPVDELSKQDDPHDLQLSMPDFNAICSRPLPTRQQQLLSSMTWGQPTVDLLASAASRKAECFVTRYECPGAAAADAFTLNWSASSLARLCSTTGGSSSAEAAGHPSSKPLAFIFPGPLSDPGRFIAKILHDRCPCILLVPRRHSYWVAMLKGSFVRDSWDMGFHDGMYFPGALAPADLRAKCLQGRLRVPLVAHRLDWQGLDS